MLDQQGEGAELGCEGNPPMLSDKRPPVPQSDESLYCQQGRREVALRVIEALGPKISLLTHIERATYEVALKYVEADLRGN